MPRRWWLFLLVLGIIGAFVFWQRSQESQEMHTSFTSQQLHVRFEYPEGWKVVEVPHTAHPLAGEVQMFGPRREDLRYSLYFDVTAEIATPSATQPVTLAETANRSLAQLRKLPSFHVLEQTQTRCAGQSAIRTLLSYTLPLPIDGVNRKSVEFRQVVTYCLHNAHLYRITFAAPTENFEQHANAYKHLLNTLKFLQ